LCKTSVPFSVGTHLYSFDVAIDAFQPIGRGSTVVQLLLSLVMIEVRESIVTDD